jgi:hypothetical protein
MIPGSEHRSRRKASTIVWAVVALLIAHASMLAWIGLRNSPGMNELPHLASGLSHWNSGRFDLYRVNPPLVRLVAALPLLFLDAHTNWRTISDDPYARPEFGIGEDFGELNRANYFFYVTLARWICIPFSVLGGIVVFLWATEVYGSPAGLLAATLWCTSPNVLGNAAMITPDAGAASMGVTALYLFRRWLKKPTWTAAICAGLALGIAELTKTTWILLFSLLPALWVMWRCLGRHRHAPGDLPAALSTRPSAKQLMLILLIAVYVVDLGYGFEDSFTQLKHFSFVSNTFGGPSAHDVTGNRFANSWLGEIPVPLPANYVRGIDIQRSDFEKGKASYLRGAQNDRGWWYWYLCALAVKVPVGTWLLAGTAVIAVVRFRRKGADWRDELILVTSSAAILLLVSSQTGFSRYLRYALPIAPFCFIWISQAARAITARDKVASVLVAFFTVLSVASSVSVFPHSLSYFNEFAGGSLHGPDHLLDANIDWGQDLLFLKRWYDSHPDARPLFLQYFGFSSNAPEIAGIECRPMPRMPDQDPSIHFNFQPNWEPGWYAISVNDLYGYRHFGNEKPWFSYLWLKKPEATAGYSIYIYHLSAGDIERMRSRASLLGRKSSATTK